MQELRSGSNFDYPDERKDKVYANNYVNFENIDVIGFDLDYTLVTYTVDLQRLIYNLAKELLISSYGFPSALRDLTFDPEFAIRGLCVDRNNGVIAKLSHVQRVGSKYVYRGRKALSPTEIESLYGEFRHVSHDDISEMRPLNDMFAMAEACLVADVIQVLDRSADLYGDSYSPSIVIDDVLNAIRDVHISGAMHSAVLHDPQRFIIPTPELYDMLKRYKDSGKDLFLCTNRSVVP